MNEWITKLFEHKELLRMGHCQQLGDLNLGMGWLYYGMTRLIRPKNVVVIGSWRGFAPLIFGKALADNADGGSVYFIDPSLVDDFWKDAAAVQDYFDSLGAANIQHFLMTTQQFVEAEEYRALNEVDIVFIDGYHTEQQAKFDYEAFESLLSANGVVFFHDSVRVGTARLYGPDRVYERRVRDFIDKLKDQPHLQVLDLAFAEGLTLVRKQTD